MCTTFCFISYIELLQVFGNRFISGDLQWGGAEFTGQGPEWEAEGKR